MQSMNLYIKPYMARQAIARNGGQQFTVAQLKASIDADVVSKLPNICPKCKYLDPTSSLLAGKGLIKNPDNPSEDIECPTCGGWGQTETPVATVQTFGTTQIPTVTQP